MKPSKAAIEEAHLSSEELKQLLGEVRRENDALRLQVGWLERRLRACGADTTSPASPGPASAGAPRPRAPASTLPEAAPMPRAARPGTARPGWPAEPPAAQGPRASASAEHDIPGVLLLDAQGRISSLNLVICDLLPLPPDARGLHLFEEALPGHLGQKLSDDFHRFLSQLAAGGTPQLLTTIRKHNSKQLLDVVFTRVKWNNQQFSMIVRKHDPSNH
jgi:PAS domain-containing protein